MVVPSNDFIGVAPVMTLISMLILIITVPAVLLEQFNVRVLLDDRLVGREEQQSSIVPVPVYPFQEPQVVLGLQGDREQNTRE